MRENFSAYNSKASASVLANAGLWEFNVWLFSFSTLSKNNYGPPHAINRPMEAIRVVGGWTQGTKKASCFPPVIWAGEERGGFITHVGCNDREKRGSACWVIVP